MISDLKSRAAILVEQRKPLIIDEIELPSLTFGQVRVRIEASGICGSQIGEIDGVKGEDRWLPHLLGHEACGMVEEVGDCVKTVKVGDRVVLHWRPGSGIEAPTPTYRWDQRNVNAGRVTTFQEQTIVSENRVTPIPESLDAVQAVLYGCALTTAYGVVSNDARVKPGESVVIFGTGGVGLCVVIAARLAGAHPIIGVDVQPAKLKLATSLGATSVIDASDEELDELLADALDGAGADVVVESTGRLNVMDRAYKLAGPRGRTILVGVPEHADRLPIDTMPLHFGKLLTGSHGGEAQPDIDIPRLVRMQLAGRFELSQVVSHTMPLEQVNEGIALIRQGEALRCVLRMDASR